VTDCATTAPVSTQRSCQRIVAWFILRPRLPGRSRSLSFPARCGWYECFHHYIAIIDGDWSAGMVTTAMPTSWESRSRLRFFTAAAGVVQASHHLYLRGVAWLLGKDRRVLAGSRSRPVSEDRQLFGGRGRLVGGALPSCLTIKVKGCLYGHSGAETKGQAEPAGPDAGHFLPGAGGHQQSPRVVNSAGHMVAISSHDLRRSSSLVIALPRVDDCLVPESRAVEGRQP
jgi:hypothetical protein